MAFLEWLFGRQTTFDQVISGPAFDVDAASIPPEIFGLSSYSDPIAPVAKLTRLSARQVPAVKRARDIICGTLGGIPLQVINRDNEVSSNALLDQPEDSVPRSVTLTRLFEDLLYDGVAWWKKSATDYRGYPTKVERLDPARVSVQDDKVYVDGRRVQYDSLIRFDSPNGALLADGARATGRRDRGR